MRPRRAALWSAGDVRRAAAPARRGALEAVGQGQEASPWCGSARAVDAHIALIPAEPRVPWSCRAPRLPVHGTPGCGSALPAVPRFALRGARGGGTVDLGDRTRGLLELQAARTELGDDPVPGALEVTAAVMEYRAALVLGHPTAAAGRRPAWLARRRTEAPRAAPGAGVDAARRRTAPRGAGSDRPAARGRPPTGERTPSSRRGCSRRGRAGARGTDRARGAPAPGNRPRGAARRACGPSPRPGGRSGRCWSTSWSGAATVRHSRGGRWPPVRTRRTPGDDRAQRAGVRRAEPAAVAGGPQGDRRGPGRLDQHDQEPYPCALREARGRHPAGGRARRPRTGRARVRPALDPGTGPPQRDAAHVRDLQPGWGHDEKGPAPGEPDDTRVVPAQSGAGGRRGLVDPQLGQLRRDRRADGAGADFEIPADGGRELLQEVGQRRGSGSGAGAVCLRPPRGPGRRHRGGPRRQSAAAAGHRSPSRDRGSQGWEGNHSQPGRTSCG